MLGYVDNNVIDVLPTDLYPQFMCLNDINSLHNCAHTRVFYTNLIYVCIFRYLLFFVSLLCSCNIYSPT